MGAKAIRVAIIEDHPLYRQGLVQVIERAPGLELVAAVGSVGELEDIGYEDVDVVILDLHLPDCQGSDAVSRSSPKTMPFSSSRHRMIASMSLTPSPLGRVGI